MSTAILTFNTLTHAVDDLSRASVSPVSNALELMGEVQLT